MKKEYSEMFEKLAPQKSDEELFGAVLSSREGDIMKNNNENKRKKRISKAVIIPIAAAIAVAGTTVGAVAIYNRNVNEEYAHVLEYPTMYDGFKWQDYKDKDGNEIDANAQAAANGLYEQLNIEFNQTFECDGFTVGFPGAVCDGKTMLLFYDITFTEGQYVPSYDRLGLVPKDLIRMQGRALPGYVESIGDNTVYHGSVAFRNIDTCTDDVFSIDFVRLSDMCGKLHGNLGFTLDVPITKDFSEYKKTVEVPSAPHVSIEKWGDWDIRSIDINSLSLNVHLTSENEVSESEVIKNISALVPAKVLITFKDGSVLDLTKQAGDVYMDAENRTFMMEKWIRFPIEVENVETIQIANALIDMDGNVTMVED